VAQCLDVLRVAHVQEAFGWSEDVVVSAGPRGALGQIWRLDVGPARYALKEIFAEPPSEALIEAELAFAERAAEAGVRLPASHPDREGRHLLAADFSMLLACRLNFLLVQARVAIDPRAERRHREWAEREIDEALRILPTPRQLADVLELTCAPGQ
jgi:hypothetical protein